MNCPLVEGPAAYVGPCRLSIVATSCGSTNQSQVRVINAVPDAPNNLDVYFNGSKIVTDMAFDAVSPTPSTPAAYTNVASGSIPIEAFTTGNTSTNSGAIVPANIDANLIGATPYTVVLDGYSTEAIAEAFEDFNTPPTTGYVEFRVINASPADPRTGPMFISSPPAPRTSPITQLRFPTSATGRRPPTKTFPSSPLAIG